MSTEQVLREALSVTHAGPTDKPPPASDAASSMWSQVKLYAKRAMAVGSLAGVALVMFYFLRIRYVPIDSLANLASVGGIAAAIAICLIGGLVLLTGLPALATDTVLKSSYRMDLLHRFWTNQHSLDHRTDTHVVSGSRILIFIGIAIGLPWLWVLLYWLPQLISTSDIWPYAVRWFCLAIWLFGAFFFARVQRPPVGDVGPMQLPTKMGYVARGAWFILYSFSGVYPLYAFMSMTQISDFDPTRSFCAGLLWLFGSTGGIVVLQALNFRIALGTITKDMTSGWVFQAVSSTYFVVVSLFVLEDFGHVLDGVMRAASLRMPHVHLVVTKEACDALRLAGVEASNHAPLSGAARGDLCVLHDVTVLSRIGSQWRLSCSRGQRIKDPTRGFSVAASSVVSWVDVLNPREPEVSDNQVCKGMWEPA